MSIRVTERDLQILEALHTARYLITPQIQKLFFGYPSHEKGLGPKKACERRMRLLHEHGLVRRIEQPVKRGEGAKPYIYALDKQGAHLLISELGVDPSDIEWKPRTQEENYPFMEHLLATTDLHIALQASCRKTSIKLVEWVDEKELRSEGTTDYVNLYDPNGQEHKTAIIPDAVFILEKDGRKGLFFVEIDRATVTISPSIWERKSWTKKIAAYLAYPSTESYQKRYEGRRARILTITTGEKRLANLKEATEKAGGKEVFWFTTLEEALDPVKLLTQPIWLVAGGTGPRSLLE